MSSRPRNRQELYDRIRETSKDEFILEDMIRLGFWPSAERIAEDPADEIRRRGELERQIAALRTEQARLHDIEAIKRELRKRRLQASKAKQLETKQRRERERLARAAAWKEKKQHEIVYLGPGVSGGLTKGAPARNDVLEARGLPAFDTAADIARAMGISVPELRFLTFSRKTSRKTHWIRFRIPKKAGGTRLISAPMPRLKRAQRWLLDNVLSKVALRDEAHGFVADRSIVTNARPHLGSAIVVNVDLKDFFPTFGFRRVKGLFESLGYGEQTATIFALLCTEPDVDEVELDGVTYFVACGDRKLPQGSPASPAITNVACRRLDARLQGLAQKLGFVYTRYADDLTFSTNDKTADCGKLLRRVRWIAEQEGLTPHEKKTRILRHGRKQEVTGVVVVDKLSVDRATLRKFRALLFQLDKDGPRGKSWGDRRDEAVLASAVGFASYVAMVDPDRGKPLLAQARTIAQKYGWAPKPRVLRRAGGGSGGRGGAGGSSTSTPREGTLPDAARLEGTPLRSTRTPSDQSVTPQGSPASAPAPSAPTPPEEPPPSAPKKKWWKIF